MSNQETISRVLELVAHLGGPDCGADELRWATDIPAGKRLLEWLASQLPDSNFADRRVAGVNRDEDPGASTLLQASLAQIALYSEEIDVLNALKARDIAPPESELGGLTPTSYELPSQSRSRANALESEADLLEKQAARLKYRLNATKKATKDMKHAIHTLRKQIQSIDVTIHEQQQRLTDLSVETDTNVARHLDLALPLLQDAVLQSAPTSSLKDTDVFESYRAEIASLGSSRASVASMIKQLYLALDDGYASLPTASELQRDAALVDVKIGELAKDKSLPKDLLHAAYVEELAKMAQELEAEPVGSEMITNIIRSYPQVSTKDEGGVSVPSLKVDVKSELERAGRMDRLMLLKAQERGLDSAIDYMRGQLIPRLQQTYAGLHAKSTTALETEVLVSALIEELEDINDAVDNAKSSISDQNYEDPDGLLEAEMIDLLKGLPSTDRHTPILLNRSDVDKEVSALSSRLSASRLADERWATQLRERTRELCLSTAPLLSGVYAHSPVNTSPPFAPSPGQAVLQADTRAKADELIGAAARLQKETELGSRDKRKLGSFVEKWVQK